MKKSKIYKRAIESVMNDEFLTGEERLEIVRELIHALELEEYTEKREAEKEAQDNEKN